MFEIDPRALKPDFKYISGTDVSNIDNKGRIIMVDKKRKMLGDDFAITIGPDGCLEAYPGFLFEELMSTIQRKSKFLMGGNFLSRHFIGDAVGDMNFDSQGRVLIPRLLREAAGLTGTILCKGCGDKVEIWSKEKYDSYLESTFKGNDSKWEMYKQAFDEVFGS